MSWRCIPAWLLLLPLGLIPAGCGTSETEKSAMRLAPLVQVAETFSEWRRLDWRRASMGTLGLVGPWQLAKGGREDRGVWLRVLGPRLGMPVFVVSGLDRELRFRARRRSPGVTRILMNGKELSRIEAPPRGWAFRVSVPSRSLEPGENVLEFDGAEGLELNGLEVRHVEQGRVPPATSTSVAVVESDVQQPAGTALRFDLRLKQGSFLRFGVDSSGMGDASAQIRVERPGMSEATILWTAERAPASAVHRVNLGSNDGEVVRLSFVVEGGPGSGSCRWIQPEVLSDSPEPDPPAPAAVEARAPVVVVIILDAAGAEHFSGYGAAAGTTPNLDRLVRESLQVARAYTQSSWTLPFVASLFTGLYPASHGVSHFNLQLDSKLDTLAERARGEGYRTLLLSQHPGLLTRTTLAQGFDVVEGIPKDQDLFREQLDRLMPRSAPFLLYLHLIVPHLPYTPPEPYPRLYADPGYRGAVDGNPLAVSRLQTRTEAMRPEDLVQLRALYEANLRYGDTLVGETLGLLRARGLHEPAAIAVLSDHGEAFWQHERLLHGANVFEEVARVPLILKLPRPGRGRLTPGPVETIRLKATLSGLMGLPASDASGAVRDLLGPEAEQADKVCLTMFLHRNSLGGLYAWRRDRWSYVFSALEPKRQLFDLLADPAERHDLAAQSPALVAELHAELTEAISRHAALGERFGDGGTIELDQETQDELERLGYVD